MSALLETQLAKEQEQIAALRAAIGRAVVGQAEVVEQLLVGLFAGGHCLLEGVPGLGKTLLVRALGQALHLSFRRVQFTPDLMPSDLIGTEILEEDHGTGKRYFQFQQGPVFTHLLLADELNRTPPKTQSALLEAMQEGTVSYAGTTHELPRPFFVLATQNPIEQAGTYPLPEAQLDRFLLNIMVDYPSAEEELQIITATTGTQRQQVPQVLDAEAVLALQARVRELHISEHLLRWIARLLRATRPGPDAPQAVRDYVQWGVGPRAGQALVLCAKARALLHGRLAATRTDIEAIALPVMRHRLLLNYRAEAEGKRVTDLIAALLQAVPCDAE
ncbi:AAA family ATPase [Pseudomarimonas arenosa]|uniref:MoxR family ATPase n=1 Tax=Pseudomarimonas arenosa TaxID=2774145 RepID=A0AAW3ZHV4_9GAMM|nr:MoxR family ATPase [Pseudomarimonas arenosa]MBD8525368.1 MoxR family ATPase [Pseudomarimonas arenosa]